MIFKYSELVEMMRAVMVVFLSSPFPSLSISLTLTHTHNHTQNSTYRNNTVKDFISERLLVLWRPATHLWLPPVCCLV